MSLWVWGLRVGAGFVGRWDDFHRYVAALSLAPHNQRQVSCCKKAVSQMSCLPIWCNYLKKWKILEEMKRVGLELCWLNCLPASLKVNEPTNVHPHWRLECIDVRHKVDQVRNKPWVILCKCCILHSLVFTCPTSCWRWRLKHVSRQNYVTESGTGIYPTLFWFYAVLPGIMVVEAQHQLFLQGQVLLTPRQLQNFPWNPSASWHADRWQLCNRVVTIGFEEPALVSSTLGDRII